MPIFGTPLTAALLLAIVLICSGCSGLALNRFESRAAQGDWAWIAAQVVECESASTTCGRLHLIKGEACLHLARADALANQERPHTADKTLLADRYRCAAHALDRGLTLRQHWSDPAEHYRYQEMFCQTLGHLYDVQPSQTAGETATRLEAAAKTLYQLDPQSVPGRYYLAAARMLQVHHELPAMTRAQRIIACERIKRTLTELLSMMETARRTPLPHWERMAHDVKRLSYHMGQTLGEIGCQR